MFAVIKIYDQFDVEFCVLFEDYDKACEYLQEAWEECYNENIYDLDGYEVCFHEEDFGQIVLRKSQKAILFFVKEVSKK